MPSRRRLPPTSLGRTIRVWARPSTPTRYDYAGAVVWNALAGVLWHRTTTLIVRHLARQLGLSEGEFRRQARVSYGKVAEFQARGLVHFHVIVRLDGPDGPHQPPPEGLTVEVLTAAIEAAARQALVTLPRQPRHRRGPPGALGRPA